MQKYNLSIGRINNAKASSTGFVNIEIFFKEIVIYATQNKMISASNFENGIRHTKHYKGLENILILDIDKGCTIVEVVKIFNNFEFIIIPSKSHRKLKDGVMQGDRFRLFIPLQGVINTVEEHYSLYKNVMNIYPFVDKACKDPARFFLVQKNILKKR